MSRPILFIDVEFNDSKLDGWGGELISMAIVDKFNEFYEVIKLDENVIISPLVRKNVIPVLNKNPIPYIDFQYKLENFLCKYWFPEGFVLISDWPDDIKYFCESLIVQPGKMIDIASFESHIDLDLNSKLSRIPHNALDDAKAVRECWLTKKLMF